ncbi:MAG TPA: transposase [Phycisphaerae bacterium]|nr:transposase [Phycisphaerae bacterium]HUT59941.1 transposase [Phycisphaerae bacterium]
MQSVSGYRKLCKRYNKPWDAHELTFSCYQRRAFLSRDRTRQFLADAIVRARELHSFDLWAYVVMPEHVHLLIWPRNEAYSVSAILKAIKQSVSRRAIGWLRVNDPSGLANLATGQKHAPYRFWQDGGGYDRNLRSAKALLRAIGYIHDNPVARGLVRRPEDWAWSSYRQWEFNGPGAISIDKEACLRSLE